MRCLNIDITDNFVCRETQQTKSTQNDKERGRHDGLCSLFSSFFLLVFRFSLDSGVTQIKNHNYKPNQDVIRTRVRVARATDNKTDKQVTFFARLNLFSSWLNWRENHSMNETVFMTVKKERERQPVILHWLLLLYLHLGKIFELVPSVTHFGWKREKDSWQQHEKKPRARCKRHLHHPWKSLIKFCTRASRFKLLLLSSPNIMSFSFLSFYRLQFFPRDDSPVIPYFSQKSKFTWIMREEWNNLTTL